MTENLMATVAANLRTIEDMAARLEARAVDRARDHQMPGGEAMVELAYVGSLETWTNRVDGLERRWSDDPYVAIEDMPNWAEAEDPDQLWPALQVLWWWSEDYRRQLGHDYDDPRWRPTLTSEAAFLRNHDVATWIWNSEPKYDDYVSDVARAKAKLERILLEGDRSDKTPVVCDRCDDGRPLVRVWGDAPDLDRWKCMGCKTQLNREELDDARATQMRRSEPVPWISRPQAVDLLRSLGHQERVAMRLVDSPETLGWCCLTTHTRWVSWPDAWRRHLSEEQARIIRRKKADERRRRSA